MTPGDNALARFSAFCSRCSEVLREIGPNETGIDFARNELPALLLDRELIATLLRNIAKGGDYPDIRHPAMFDNEVFLFADKERSFSLRLYLWGPGEFTLPHDHNSWGVVGTANDSFQVIKYRVEGDEEREGFARLRETERILLPAGGVVSTMPFEYGIHSTGNPTSQAVATLHLYGRSLGRGFIQEFDLGTNQVRKLFPPWKKKQRLAAQVLEEIANREDDPGELRETGAALRAR